MPVAGIPSEVLLAFDSFKGTFSAEAVAEAVGRGLTRGGWACSALAIADGGEGTLAVLGPALRLRKVELEVQDPLGRPVTADYGLADDGGTAVVEMARASGLGLVEASERDAMRATSVGTGELIAAAVAAGASRVLVSVGGSATTDGGAGAVSALARAGGIGGARLTVLCDVATPFESAARVFAPQKGAAAAEVAQLGARLDQLADGWAAEFGRDPRGRPRSGAAGGLAGGLWAVHGAELVSGAAYVLDALGFDGRMRRARAVITGEGRLDRQSLSGKALGEVATRCRQAGVPCHAIVGRRELSRFDQRILDLQVVLEAPGSLDALEGAGAKLARLL